MRIRKFFLSMLMLMAIPLFAVCAYASESDSLSKLLSPRVFSEAIKQLKISKGMGSFSVGPLEGDRNDFAAKQLESLLVREKGITVVPFFKRNEEIELIVEALDNNYSVLYSEDDRQSFGQFIKSDYIILGSVGDYYDSLGKANADIILHVVSVEDASIVSSARIPLYTTMIKIGIGVDENITLIKILLAAIFILFYSTMVLVVSPDLAVWSIPVLVVAGLIGFFIIPRETLLFISTSWLIVFFVLLFLIPVFAIVLGIALRRKRG